MNAASSLEQHVDCPDCGWTQVTVDAADGLHAINRACQRRRCRTYFVAAFRGSELVGAAQLDGTDAASYEEALTDITGLTEAERQRLMLTARDRALELT